MNKKGEDKSFSPKQSGSNKSNKALATTEEEILEFWNKNQIFQKTLDKKAPKGEFVFYEGPPTANGKPGIHHLEARAFKDVIPRYKTMQGFHVRRKGGWDTHGLPVELQVEKELGLKSKKEIESYGIEAFNKKCKENVWQYVDLWEKFTDRMGYWIDQKNPYITYENSYIESVWNILSTVNEKKLLYKDYKVLPWCPRCGTALSSHELAQGYENVKDLSVTVEFRIAGRKNTSILAWTTTPWTLPGNLALAVNPDILYVEIEKKDMGTGDLVRFILAKERLSAVFPSDEYSIVKEMKGKNLVGLEYEPLYPFLKDKFKDKNPSAFEKAYKVYKADFVNTEDGTGIVHTAVMYGPDDFELGTKIGLPKSHLVDEAGKFISGTGFLSGRFVRGEDLAGDIIKDLAKRGLLFKKEKYEHAYPFCWRCHTPLIYYARDSWYIAMSRLRHELVEENKKINWEPEYIKEGRFGEWLREIKDWAISRERYWGTPLPIWTNKNGNKTVVGSLDELKKLTKKSGNKYFVMRHGEAIDNAKHILDPKGDPNNHLTDKGKSEAILGGEKLKSKKIDLIFSSPFLRTKETAEIVRTELGLSREAVIQDERLHEYNEKDVTFVRKRIGDFIYEIESKYKEKNFLIISHGNPLWFLKKISSWSGDNDFIEEQMLNTGEVKELSFSPMPHNENFELDLHRPFIDTVELENEKGEPLTRVKEVLDVWFDSGAMPFAQYADKRRLDADGRGKESFEKLWKKMPYPADFISEAIDQTRGWFYTLHAIGVLMGKGKSYKNVICLGHVLDAEGKKMSKSIGNVVDPWEMMDKYGADALRFWMYSVNQPGDSKNFDEKIVDDVVKKVFNLAENILAFYELYKDEFVAPSDKSKNILDKWIISRLNELLSLGTKSLDKYKPFEASRALRDFINDFSTWYLRRSRERFKLDDLNEKKEALQTTRFVLLELAKYMAPFTPFFAEIVYQKVRDNPAPESIHLCNWPETGKIHSNILENMRIVRDIVSRALELRQKAGIKVRQPLGKLKVKSKKFGNEYLEILKDELNIKEIEFNETIKEEVWLDTNLTEELKKEGMARDIIRGIQDARKTENLNPGEKIKLVVSTSEDIKTIINSYLEMIQTPTQVASIMFSEDKQKHNIDIEGQKISVSILK